MMHVFLTRSIRAAVLATFAAPNLATANVFGESTQITDVGRCNVISTGDGDNNNLNVNCEWIDAELREKLEAFLSKNLEISEDPRFKLNQLGVRWSSLSFADALLTSDQRTITWFLQAGMPPAVEADDGHAVTHFIYRNQSSPHIPEILATLASFGLDIHGRYTFRGIENRTLIEHAVIAGNADAAATLVNLGTPLDQASKHIEQFKKDRLTAFNKRDDAITQIEAKLGLLAPLSSELLDVIFVQPDLSPTQWAVVVQTSASMKSLSYRTSNGSLADARRYAPTRFLIPLDRLSDYVEIKYSGQDSLGRELSNSETVNLIGTALNREISLFKQTLKEGNLPIQNQNNKILYDFSRLLQYGAAISSIKVGINHKTAGTELVFDRPSNEMLLRNERVFGNVSPAYYEFPLIDHMTITVELVSGEVIGCDYNINYAFLLLTPLELSSLAPNVDAQFLDPCRNYFDRTGTRF